MKGERKHRYRLLGLVILSIFNFQFSISAETLGMRELGDSLMAYTGFSPVWSPNVRVKSMRVNGGWGQYRDAYHGLRTVAGPGDQMQTLFGPLLRPDR